MIHRSSGREGHNNYRRDLVIWLVHLIYTVRLAKVALCYNYVILNYCIRFAVLPCVRLCLNSCLFIYHYYYKILNFNFAGFFIYKLYRIYILL